MLFTVLRMFPGLVPARYRVPVIKVSSELAAVDHLEVAKGASGGNLLLITLDTTRADRLGCYGNKSIETPNLDGLARAGALFTHAYTPVPVTLPSHSTMMTGLYPSHHGARINALTALADNHVTLAETLAGKGYQTAAFVSAFVLDRRFGIAQGFDTYNIKLETETEHWAAIAERRGDATCDAALAWLEQSRSADKPFFMWVHFFDAHWRYQPPSPFAEQYKDFPYDGEIAFVDAQVGRLLDALRESGALKDTLVVVAGDHGESLGQHNEESHGTLVYDPTMHVPLIFSGGPTLASKGVYLDAPVNLVDLAPTTLSLLGMPALEGVDGVDLTKPQKGDRTFYFNTLEGMAEYGWTPFVGVQRGFLKYIHGPTDELYDLKADPVEANDLLASQPDVVKELREAGEAFYEGSLENAFVMTGIAQLAPEEIEKLKALGYLVGGGTHTYGETELLDPKKYMPLMREVNTAFDVTEENWQERGIERVKKIVAAHPEFYIAHRELGAAYTTIGKLDDAAREFQTCLEYNPNMTAVKGFLAAVKTRQGYHKEAIELYKEIVAELPNDGRSLALLGALLVKHGQFPDALPYLMRAQAVMPLHPDVAMDLAKVYMAMGKPDEAIAELRAVVAKAPSNERLRLYLVKTLRNSRRFEEAVEVLRDAYGREPENIATAATLALVLTEWKDPSRGHQREAVAILEKVNEQTHQKDAQYMHALGRAYASVRRLDDAVRVSQQAQILAANSNRTALAGIIDRELAAFIVARDQLAKGKEPDDLFEFNTDSEEISEGSAE
ncbi:MAG: tetratricopeptide repeat protein [Phycisphaerales bacterium]|nr:tetratricopeptide repeat protein [Phycisphaerales bacterium]